jgi:hypothetical protein
VRRSETEQGRREGLTTSDRELERENRELRRAKMTSFARRVGSIRDSYDNGLAQTIMGPWRGIDAVELATLAWVD